MIHPLRAEDINLDTLKYLWNLLVIKTRPKSFSEVTPDQLEEKINSGVPLTIVDCRDQSSFNTIGHIQNALNHPYQTFDETMHEIPRSRQVVVACYVGAFSQIAADKLAKSGHKNVLSMKHGMERWIGSDKPVIKQATEDIVHQDS